jgi:hypothetical protein
MDIHAPSEPILTLKQAVVHLAIVTAGILIAFSFEGIRSWIEHRSLVNEARANLLSEIRDNRKEVAVLVDSLTEVRHDLEHASDVARALRERTNGAPGDAPTLRFNYRLAQLGTASRTTAEVTGAFGYMDYDEVKRFASVYDLQSAFVRTQDRVVSGGLSAFAAVQLWDPARTTPGEIEDWTRQIRLTYAAVAAEQQIGGALVRAYDELLAEGRQRFRRPV